MKINRSIVITTLVLAFCSSLSVSAQVSGEPYPVIQPNIVLNATVGDGFKPFETRMLSKGTWEVRAIKGEGTEEKDWAWTSWQTLSNPWTGADCNNGKSRGWTTTFYVSVVGVDIITNRWAIQYPSAKCRTKALAIENAKDTVSVIKLASNSAVTFFLGAAYDTPRPPLGGGLTLTLRKQQQQQRQRQRP
jgi:hypothetical protein